MSFEKIPAGQVVDDALRGDMTCPIPYQAFALELRGWKQHAAQTNDRQLPKHFVPLLKHALRIQSDGLLRLVAQDKEHAYRHIRDASAIIAISRLMRRVSPIWLDDDPAMEVIGDDGKYTETSKGKRLLDVHQATHIADAHGLTMHRETLAGPPFYSDLPDRSEQWFVDRSEGLYVAARTPAETTHVLREKLSVSVGGMAAAEALIDAPNSVTLLPYLSYRDLNGLAV